MQQEGAAFTQLLQLVVQVGLQAGLQHLVRQPRFRLIPENSPPLQHAVLQPVEQLGAGAAQVGAALPHEGAAAPQVGAAAPHEGAAAPQEGATLPHEGAACPQLGAAAVHPVLHPLLQAGLQQRTFTHFTLTHLFSQQLDSHPQPLLPSI